MSTTTRFFQIGNAKVKDTCSGLPFDTAVEFLSKKFPQIRHSRIYESDAVAQDDGTLLYVVPLLKAATNG